MLFHAMGIFEHFMALWVFYSNLLAFASDFLLVFLKDVLDPGQLPLEVEVVTSFPRDEFPKVSRNFLIYFPLQC